MATAKKLPSGNWRVLCFEGTKGGKRQYVSFTAETKKEAELKAALYLREAKPKTAEITVEQAIERYITAKTAVLSPSTITAYRSLQRTHYEQIGKQPIKKLTTEDLQLFVSDLALRVSPKTVANSYGLLVSAVTMFRPDAIFRVTLPKKAKRRKSSPTNEDVQTLFLAADGRLKLCIALAAFGSMRRGEICALKYGDVTGNRISIHADIVRDENNNHVYKEIPKTSDSIRTVSLPPEIIGLIGSGNRDDFIVDCTPNALTHAFMRLRNRLQINIRLHDLRHYYASIGAVLGVPDIYLSEFGGWKNGSDVMKEVYQNTMVDLSGQYANKMIDHFQTIISG